MGPLGAIGVEFGAIAGTGVNTGAIGMQTGDIREELGVFGVEIWGH